MAGEGLARDERRFGRRKCPDRDLEQLGGVLWPKRFLRWSQRFFRRCDLHHWGSAPGSGPSRPRQARSLNRHGFHHLGSRFHWLGGRLSWRFLDPRSFLLHQFLVQTRERFERRSRAVVFAGCCCFGSLPRGPAPYRSYRYSGCEPAPRRRNPRRENRWRWAIAPGAENHRPGPCSQTQWLVPSFGRQPGDCAGCNIDCDRAARRVIDFCSRSS